MFFTAEGNRKNEEMRRWVFHSGMVTPVEPPPQEEQEKLKQISDIVRSIFPDEWTRSWFVYMFFLLMLRKN